MVIGDLSHMSYLWVCISGCLSVFLYFCLSVYFFVLSLVICGRCLLWMSVQFGGRPWLLCGCLFLCVSVCMFFSVYLFVCISGCMFFSVFLFVCSPLCMVIGDLSHVFALDVSPIRGQALASPPFRQRAATQNVFRHGKGSLGNALLEYEKYRVIFKSQPDMADIL